MKKKRMIISGFTRGRLLLLTLCSLFTLVLPAQERKTITGTITDTSGETIIGASVFVKGTTLGTVSDIDGHFMLEVADDAVLTISYIGYLTRRYRWKAGARCRSCCRKTRSCSMK